MAITDSGTADGTATASLLERENARLTAALRRVRMCLEVALDPDADERMLRDALHEARHAAAEADRLS
jgi:hypothetical protein